MKTTILLLCCTPLFGVRADLLHAKIEVTFDGTSTLHDFTGNGKSESPADWTRNETEAVLSIADVSFDVKSLSTDHKKRDRNMLKMFEPDDHPEIRGTIKNWHLSGKEATDQILILNIHGQSLEVPVRMEAYEITPEGKVLNGSFTLSLKACDLKRPSVMGVIRVGDEVKLHVKLLLTQP
ncbi:YceI family protein [Kiritimatiellaeota bacterium B1221]|nr:YceI family protein [Kiritimatiellaeota bacterium B1221]